MERVVPISSPGVRRYEYRPSVTLSRSLSRELEDVVLRTFDEWKENGGGDAS